MKIIQELYRKPKLVSALHSTYHWGFWNGGLEIMCGVMENAREICRGLCLLYLNLSACDDPVCLLGKSKEAFTGSLNSMSRIYFVSLKMLALSIESGSFCSPCQKPNCLFGKNKWDVSFSEGLQGGWFLPAGKKWCVLLCYCHLLLALSLSLILCILFCLRSSWLQITSNHLLFSNSLNHTCTSFPSMCGQVQAVYVSEVCMCCMPEAFCTLSKRKKWSCMMLLPYNCYKPVTHGIISHVFLVAVKDCLSFLSVSLTSLQFLVVRKIHFFKLKWHCIQSQLYLLLLFTELSPTPTLQLLDCGCIFEKTWRCIQNMWTGLSPVKLLFWQRRVCNCSNIKWRIWS